MNNLISQIKIENGKVVDHKLSELEIPGYRKINVITGIYYGMSINLFSADYSRLLTEKELREKEPIVDNRGIYYNKKTLEKKEVTQLNVTIEKGYTKEVPCSQFCVWDEKKQKFVYNTALKKTQLFTEIKSKAEETIYSKYPLTKQLNINRTLLAVAKGNTLTSYELKEIEEMDTFINSIRLQSNKLEEKLNALKTEEEIKNFKVEYVL